MSSSARTMRSCDASATPVCMPLTLPFRYLYRGSTAAWRHAPRQAASCASKTSRGEPSTTSASHPSDASARKYSRKPAASPASNRTRLMVRRYVQRRAPSQPSAGPSPPSMSTPSPFMFVWDAAAVSTRGRRAAVRLSTTDEPSVAARKLIRSSLPRNLYKIFLFCVNAFAAGAAHSAYAEWRGGRLVHPLAPGRGPSPLAALVHGRLRAHVLGPGF